MKAGRLQCKDIPDLDLVLAVVQVGMIRKRRTVMLIDIADTLNGWLPLPNSYPSVRMGRRLWWASNEPDRLAWRPSGVPGQLVQAPVISERLIRAKFVKLARRGVLDGCDYGDWEVMPATAAALGLVMLPTPSGLGGWWLYPEMADRELERQNVLEAAARAVTGTVTGELISRFKRI